LLITLLQHLSADKDQTWRRQASAKPLLVMGFAPAFFIAFIAGAMLVAGEA
jgi:hypothetical protein